MESLMRFVSFRENDSAEMFSSYKSKLTIDDLPDEILLIIMSHFNTTDLVLVISDVCRRWNNLARDLELWKKLSFDCDHATEFSEIRKVLCFSSCLQSLIMSQRKDAFFFLQLFFLKCRYLRELFLFSCDLSNFSVKNFGCKYPETYLTLESLSFEGCSHFSCATTEVISNFRSLKSLNLSHTKGVTGSNICDIARNCINISDLRIDDVTQVFDSDVKCIINCIGENLNVLILDGEVLTDDSYCCLAKCFKLKTLRISFCSEMTDKGLLKGLSKFEGIHSLAVRKGQLLTEKGLSSYFKYANLLSLRYLDFSECSTLSDVALQFISYCCPLLETVILCWCWELTEMGLADLVARCKHLKIMDLLGIVLLTGEVIFKDIPTRLPNLRYLNLEQCNNVSEMALKYLLVEMPDLYVTNYFGYRLFMNVEEDMIMESADTWWSIRDILKQEFGSWQLI